MTTKTDDRWNHEMNCPVGMEDADLVLQEMQQAKDDRRDAHAVEEIRKWLMPVLVGGLSAGRSSTVHDTAERLAETILIGIDNTLRGRHCDLFDPTGDDLSY